MWIDNIDRIEELKRNETLLYNLINYLIELWGINNDDDLIEHFEKLGFSKEDIDRLEIKEVL